VRRHASKLLVGLLLIAAWIGGYGYGRWYGPGTGARVEQKKPTGYYCPMHPSFRSDKPGDCGICGMKLVPDNEPAQSPAATAQEAGMPVAPPPGTIHISAEKQQLIGVTYGAAEYTTAGQSFRANGKVAVDETRIAKVQTRVDGWVEKVFVDFTGKFVEKGSPMLTMYSPEMFATQQEYLLAIKGHEIMKGSTLKSGADHGASLVDAARRRLELWDLSASQIAEIERTGTPIRNITVHAPISGYVTTRNAFPKQRITPETELYTLTDLSRVWIFADVFENEAPLIREGLHATVTLTYAGGRRLGARVAYIQPAIEETTRTLRVRLEADNPGLILKPEMFVDVEFHTGGSRKLTVPAEAVLDSGLRQTVFVDRGQGHLEPREVRVGDRFDGRVEIVSGLRAGERVVTSGNFLIDSESRLRSAAAGGTHQHSGAAAPQEPAGATAPDKRMPPPDRAVPKPTPGGAHKHD
jgi:RND family efflux transporter MFP subunit